MITDGSLNKATLTHRSLASSGNREDARRAKNRMPAFTPAVECSGGKEDKDAIGLTGVSLCDFDHLTDLSEAIVRVTADPHTMMTYTTISGNGLRVLYKIDTTDMKDYPLFYKAGNDYYSRLIGSPSDRQCKNLARLSIICHDPEAIYVPDSKPFTKKDLLPPDKRQKSKQITPLERSVKAAAKRLRIEGIDYEPGSYNDYVSRTGYILNALGIPHDEAEKWAIKRFGDYDEKEVRSIFRSCYSKKDEYGTVNVKHMEHDDCDNKGTSNGGSNATVAEIENFLRNTVDIRRNIITSQTEIRYKSTTDTPEGEWEEINDRLLATLWTQMSKEVKRVNLQNIKSVIVSDIATLWNPFKSYFDSLPDWNGTTDYIGRIADMIHLKTNAGSPDSDILRQQFIMCFKKWIVGIVASLLGNSVNNVVFILIGKQGIFKTTFFHYLFPLPLRKYFYIKTNSSTMDKDDRIAVAEHALICLEELDSLKTRELNHIKALITDPIINERAPYAHYRERRRHIASFCGTGNNIQFLNDPTGNRRWLPFEIDSITDPHHFNYLHDQVFAQALSLFHSGFRHWFTCDDTNELSAHLSHFEVANVEEELINTYYRKPKPGEQYKLLTASNILERINANIRGTLSVVKIGQALTKLGYEKQRAGNSYKYRVIELRHDEINREYSAPMPF